MKEIIDKPESTLEKIAKVNARNYRNGIGGDIQTQLAGEFDFYQGFITGASWHKEWSLSPIGDAENTAYIRKDTLMNYFHQRIEELNSPLNGVFGSTERDNCNERISELLLLIDKLNEM